MAERDHLVALRDELARLEPAEFDVRPTRLKSSLTAGFPRRSPAIGTFDDAPITPFQTISSCRVESTPGISARLKAAYASCTILVFWAAWTS